MLSLKNSILKKEVVYELHHLSEVQKIYLFLSLDLPIEFIFELSTYNELISTNMLNTIKSEIIKKGYNTKYWKK